MSINNYTNIGITPQQFATLKEQIRQGKTFGAMTYTVWTSGNATFNVSETAFANFTDALSEFRLKTDEGTVWTDWRTATGDIITATGQTITVDEDVIPSSYSGNVLMIEVKVAEGYVRLATANTWNQYNTAIKTTLFKGKVTKATSYESNGTYSVKFSDLLTSSQLANYIAMDEDAEIEFTINVPSAPDPAVFGGTTVSGFTYNSATLSGSKYNVSLNNGTASSVFDEGGTVDADDPFVAQNITTTIELNKLTVDTSSPTCSSGTATFSASNSGFVAQNDSVVTLNCYDGALDV